MQRRTFAFALLAVVALVTWTIPALANDVHMVKVVKVDGNKLTISDKEGKNQQVLAVPETAKITLDGKPCKLADLKAGTDAKITTEKKGNLVVIVSIEAGKAS